MSLLTKKRFKNIGKVVAGVLFALLMFTNIKIGLLDDTFARRPAVNKWEVTCHFGPNHELLGYDCVNTSTDFCNCDDA